MNLQHIKTVTTSSSPGGVCSGPEATNIRWLDIDASETPDHPGLVEQLLAVEFDGMVVRGVFPLDAVARALEYFGSLTDAWHDQHFGAMLGRPLNLGGSESQDRTPFLDDTDRCRPLYREAFGFDPHERLAEVLSPMMGSMGIGTPIEDGRAYNPGNVRRYLPGYGGLRVHAGNDFLAMVGEGAMSHIRVTTKVHDHLSYFVVLQPPERGGGLSVFERLWVEGRPEGEVEDLSAQDPSSSYSVGLRNDPAFDPIPRLVLSPGPGDLILFGGGRRFHRVDPIEGSIPRITYGGFAAPSADGTVLHFWC